MKTTILLLCAALASTAAFSQPLQGTAPAEPIALGSTLNVNPFTGESLNKNKPAEEGVNVAQKSESVTTVERYQPQAVSKEPRQKPAQRKASRAIKRQPAPAKNVEVVIARSPVETPPVAPGKLTSVISVGGKASTLVELQGRTWIAPHGSVTPAGVVRVQGPATAKVGSQVLAVDPSQLGRFTPSDLPAKR